LGDKCPESEWHRKRCIVTTNKQNKLLATRKFKAGAPPGECCRLCKVTAGCRSWSAAKKGAECTMFSSAGVESDGACVAGEVSPD